jgi:hypothetical protein
MDEPVCSADQVADLLDVVMDANSCIAVEAARIAESGEWVSQGMVERLTSLGQRLRPGAAARVRLGSVDPDLLLAGTSMWLMRQRRRSARARAASRWTGPAA